MTATEDLTAAERMARMKDANKTPAHGVKGLPADTDAYLTRLISLSPGHDNEEECEGPSLCRCTVAEDAPIKGSDYAGRGWMFGNRCGQVAAVLIRVEADRIRNALRYRTYTPEPGFREEVLRDFLLLYAAGHGGRMLAWLELLKALNVTGEERTRLVDHVLRSLNGVEAPAFLRWPHGRKHPRMKDGAPGTVCEGSVCGGRAETYTEQMLAVFHADYRSHVARDAVYAVPHRGRHAHRALMEVDGKPVSAFGSRIIASAYEKLRRQPKSENVNALAALILGQARRAHDEADELPAAVPVRATPHGRGYLIDLGTDGKYAQVTAKGWKVVDHQEGFPVMLASERALPIPVHRATGDDPRLGHLGFKADDPNWHQIRMWQATAFFADHERQMMLLTGGSGSGKSKRAESIAWIVDPLEVDEYGNPVMGGPLPDDEALGPQLARNYLFTSDNLTTLKHEDSDRLCRISTGYSFVRRVLFTTNDLYTVTVKRPGLLTGIEVPNALAEDAQNRMLHLELDANAPKRPSVELAHERVELGPVMLGALLDDMVAVLRAYRAGEYDHQDRFPIVACAAQTFGEEYVATREARKGELARKRAEGDTLLAAIAKMVKYAGVPVGSADETGERARMLDLTGSELMQALETTLPHGSQRPKGWPTTPQGLTRRFSTNRDTPKAFGLTIEPVRTKSERRQRLMYVPGGETVSIPEPPSPAAAEMNKMYPDDRRKVRGPFVGPEADVMWERVRDRTEDRLDADRVNAETDELF